VAGGLSPGCGAVVRGGCIFALNFSVTRSPVLTEGDRTI
jgi:hypothetical protein